MPLANYPLDYLHAQRDLDNWDPRAVTDQDRRRFRIIQYALYPTLALSLLELLVYRVGQWVTGWVVFRRLAEEAELTTRIIQAEMLVYTPERMQSTTREQLVKLVEEVLELAREEEEADAVGPS